MIERLGIERLGGWPYAIALTGLVVAAVAGALQFRAVLPELQDTTYWIAAVGASVFYGFGSLAVWRQPEPSSPSRGPVWPWRVHMWWLNGAGAFVGFYAAHLLWTHLSQAHDFGLGVFALGLVAFLGVTGWLPYTAMGLAKALDHLARKAVEAAGK